MATVFWEGTADAVAQVSDASIDTVDGTPANNTFTITIGGDAISQVGDTDVSTTAAALVATLNASTNPYFSGITWTNPSSGNITGTADNAGEPFVASLTVSGAGTGSVTDFSDSTASAGPNHWDTAANWSGGAVPVNSDDVIIKDSDVNILWGLSQAAVDLTSLTIESTYTGYIGLPRRVFTTNANGSNFTDTKIEYRQDYLDIGWTTGRIGITTGPDTGAGSRRLKLDNDKAGASTTTIYSTATQSADIGLSPVRLLFAHANADVYVRSGTVSIAGDAPNETTTIGELHCIDGQVFTSDGVTVTTVKVNGGGQHIIDCAATITTLEVNGGTVRTEGSQAITTITVNGGTLTCNNTGTVTTMNIDGGTVDGRSSNEARTWTTCNLDRGTLMTDDDWLTITTFDQPAGRRTVAVQES